MSRSIGDTLAHSVGCLCEPEININKLTSQDKIIVIASDGLWEFLKN
jgi:serine/threonine protein phosphatase PrpC